MEDSPFFKALDTSGDGLLDFNEFVSGMQKLLKEQGGSISQDTLETHFMVGVLGRDVLATNSWTWPGSLQESSSMVWEQQVPARPPATSFEKGIPTCLYLYMQDKPCRMLHCVGQHDP